MMTRQNFKVIAAILKDNLIIDPYSEYEDGRVAQVHYIAVELADAFQNDNPRFDRVKFLEACGL